MTLIVTLTELFRGINSHCPIVSFYENKPTVNFGIVSAPFVVAVRWVLGMVRLTRGQVVDEASADVDLAENVEEALGRGPPLSWSVTHQHQAVIDLLLEKGAAIDIRDERRSLLGWAASSGSIAIFGKLRSSAREQHLELDPDGADVEGNTPFMLAAAKGHVDMLEYLYGLQRHGEAQINVHRQNQQGNTVRRRA